MLLLRSNPTPFLLLPTPAPCGVMAVGDDDVGIMMMMLMAAGCVVAGFGGVRWCVIIAWEESGVGIGEVLGFTRKDILVFAENPSKGYPSARVVAGAGELARRR
ncbi:hypothetical protein Tco_1142982 [Tanacetum coccineum]|uniref:Uncharacterized protein n=1 Tax=Tanacetum coccineum TaxID=301880 RepID=A0ABQ5HQ22_9ASTR